MPVGNVLGRAYIEVHADTSPFARELGVEVEKIATAAEKSGKTRKSGEKVAQSFTDGVRRRMQSVRKSLLGDIFRLFTPGGSSGEGNRFKKLGTMFGQLFVQGLSGGLKGIGNAVSSIGASIGNVGKSGPFSALIGVVIVALIPAVIALVQQFAALVNVIYLIPGAVTTAIGVILPLIFAFHGFSTAISAITSGDPQQIAEALKGLTPAARGVAIEFQKLMPFFKQLRDIAQEKFFKQITGDLTALFKAVGPTVGIGFGLVATAAGKIANSFLKLFSSPGGKQFFATMFSLAQVFLNTIGPGVVNLTAGLMSLSVATSGPLGDLFTSIGNGLTKFGNFLTQLGQSGDAQKLISDFRIALDKLIILGTNSYDLIKAILGSADARGAATEFFNTLIDVIKQLTLFFQSKRAEEGMQTLIRLASLLLVSFAGILELVITIAGWLGSVIDLVRWLYNHSLAHIPGFSQISGPVPTANGVEITGSQGGPIAHHAAGTVTSGPEVSWIGEKGPEVVIPLTDPARAQQLANQSGLNDLLGSGDTHVNVYLDGELVQSRVEKTVAKGLRAFGRGMKFGPRPVTAGA